MDPGYCSACGTDIKIYNRLFRLSNTYYNMGLEKAKARNLTGAMQDLRYSLRLNKNHIQARNLLGLVYFEVGEVVLALTEWIISKSLEPDKNIADEYIRAIQENPSRWAAINQTIKKYNQSLLYCQQGSEDLAIIQLKKVLSLNPKLVKGHQLLALLYIKTEEYERAGRELRRALAIDKTDNLSLHYQEELERITGKAVNPKEKPAKEIRETKNSDIISYTSGNETIIMPATYKDTTGMNVVLNLLIVLVVGVAIMWFLVVPAKVRSIRSETNQQIIAYSDEVSAKQTELNGLQKQVEELQAALAEKEAEPETGGSYEQLIEAYNAFRGENLEAALGALNEVDTQQISEGAMSLYREVYRAVHAEELKGWYDAGETAYNAGNWAEAVENLQRVVDMEEMYQDGYAIYYLARAYESSEDTEKAVPLFRKFAEAYPGTVRANYCNQALTRLGQPAVEQQQSNQPQQPQEPQGPQENQPQDPQPPA